MEQDKGKRNHVVQDDVVEGYVCKPAARVEHSWNNSRDTARRKLLKDWPFQFSLSPAYLL